MFNKTPNRYRGHAIIYFSVCSTVLLLMASLAVDFGRVQTVNAELQTAAFAAARAAAYKLDSDPSAVVSTAIATAASCAADGTPVVVNAADVIVGYWDEDASTFTPGAYEPNAVRVTASRTAAAGNAVPLMFASLAGFNSCDSKSTSTCVSESVTTDYNLAAVKTLSFASLGVLATIKGDVAAIEDVNIGMPLGLLVGVQGDARSYSGVTKKGSLAAITGSKAKLTKRLVYPSVTLPLKNDNANITAFLDASDNYTAIGMATIPAGTYVVNNFTMAAAADIRLAGPVTFYVKGQFTLAASVNLLGAATFTPSNFKVRVLPGGTVLFLANIGVPLCIDLYAPDSDVNIGVSLLKYVGRLIGRNVTIAVPLLSEFDVSGSLPPATGEDHHVKLVK